MEHLLETQVHRRVTLVLKDTGVVLVRYHLTTVLPGSIVRRALGQLCLSVPLVHLTMPRILWMPVSAAHAQEETTAAQMD